MNDEFTSVNNKTHTVESMLKDAKNHLNNLEILLSKVEKSEVFDKEKNISSTRVKADIDEIEKIKNDVDKIMKSISTIMVKDEHKFMLNKYKEIKEGLKQRNRILMKNLSRILESKRLEELISDKKSSTGNIKGIELLNEENQSLNACLQISEDLKKRGMNAEEELELQQKTLKKNQDKVSLIISKVPGLNKILKSIKFHKYKEKIIMGVVIGTILFFGLYLTYY